MENNKIISDFFIYTTSINLERLYHLFEYGIMHRYHLFRIIVIVFVETITHCQILFVNSEISEDKITNVEKPLIFVVHGYW